MPCVSKQAAQRKFGSRISGRQTGYDEDPHKAPSFHQHHDFETSPVVIGVLS